MLLLLSIFFVNVILLEKYFKQKRILHCQLTRTRWRFHQFVNYYLISRYFSTFKFFATGCMWKMMCKHWFVSFFFLSFLQPTIPAEGRPAPRIGNIGHLTRISNKLIQLGNNNSEIEAYLQVFISAYFCLLVVIA